MNRKNYTAITGTFSKAADLKDKIKGFALIMGIKVPELIETTIRGTFKITGKPEMENELNLEYGWYKVIRIYNKYIEVHVPGEGNFKVEKCPGFFRERKCHFKITGPSIDGTGFGGI